MWEYSRTDTGRGLPSGRRGGIAGIADENLAQDLTAVPAPQQYAFAAPVGTAAAKWADVSRQKATVVMVRRVDLRQLQRNCALLLPQRLKAESQCLIAS